jgi:hypothetical protein
MHRGIDMDPMAKVSVRDFTIFQLKLLIDGLKDGAVFTVSFVAFAVDLVFRRHGRRRFFYKVMRVSERLDLWLNLHGAAEETEGDAEGLFGQSEAGSDTMLGQLEQIVRGADAPPPPSTCVDSPALPSGSWVQYDAPRPGGSSTSFPSGVLSQNSARF